MVIKYEDMFFQSLLIDFKDEFLEFFNIRLDDSYDELFFSCESKNDNQYQLNLEFRLEDSSLGNMDNHIITTEESENKNNYFLHSIKDYDGDSYLEYIIDIICSKRALTHLEMLKLILIPLMHTKKDVYGLLCETVCLTNKIREISLDDLKMIKASQYIIMQRFIKEKSLKDLIMEELTMESSVIELFDKIRENEVLFEGKRQIAKNMLRNNFKIDEISYLTNLSEDEIKAII